MGQVYAAYDPKLDRKVALKVLHEEREGGEQPRLVHVAQASARLSHPNVVGVHDVGTHGGKLRRRCSWGRQPTWRCTPEEHRAP